MGWREERKTEVCHKKSVKSPSGFHEWHKKRTGTDGDGGWGLIGPTKVAFSERADRQGREREKAKQGDVQRPGPLHQIPCEHVGTNIEGCDQNKMSSPPTSSAPCSPSGVLMLLPQAPWWLQKTEDEHERELEESPFTSKMSASHYAEGQIQL